MATLTREQIVTIEVLQQRGQSQCETARILGVSEGTVRYHLRRAQEAATDGRQKPSLIEQLGLVEAVAHWWQGQVQLLGQERPPSVQLLHEFLRAEHGYDGSYKAVRKFVRARYGRPPIRPFRRVETPPGAQTQSDWGEFRRVDLGDADGPTTVYAFVMVLGHCRKKAVVWSRSMDQLAWHHVHNKACRRHCGVAAVNRIDNLKAGIATGCGPCRQASTKLPMAFSSRRPRWSQARGGAPRRGHTRPSGQADVVDEGGVVAAGGVQPLEGDRVRPGGDGEGGRQAGVAGARGGERAHRHAVDQHLEVLARGLVVARCAASKLSW